MPPEVGKLLDLIQQYGLAIVVAVVASIAALYLFRLYKASWEARLKAEQDHTAEWKALREEERDLRMDTEGRLAASTAALQTASSIFKAAQEFQQQIVEKLVERSAPARRRG